MSFLWRRLQAKLSVVQPRGNRVTTVVEQTELGYTASAVFEQKLGMLMFFR